MISPCRDAARSAPKPVAPVSPLLSLLALCALLLLGAPPASARPRPADAAGPGFTDGTECSGDTDSDGDGIVDLDEDCAGNADSDADGIVDYLDVDDDGDGIPTLAEGDQFTDTDADFKPDYLDLDSDGDAIPDSIEGDDRNQDGAVDHLPTGADSDGNGLDDGYDPPQGGFAMALQDSDCDGLRDVVDADDDDDGELTLDEGDGDSDHDSVPDYLDPLNLDAETLFVDDFESESFAAWCQALP